MKDKILELLNEKKYNSLFELLLECNAVDLAFLMGELENEDMIKIFRLLSKDSAAEVFSYMEPDDQERLISLFSDRELHKIIDEMYFDDTVDLVSEMPAFVVKRILKTAAPEQRRLINEFLQYPDDSAGSLMTIEFVDLKSHMSVEQAIEKIRAEGIDKETIYTCYVLDDTRQLIGIVDIKDLLTAGFDTPVSELMQTSVITAHTLENKEDVARRINKYDLLALPVVDRENRLVGIITIDDAVEVIEEETAADFEKMAAITPTDESYFRTGVWRHSRSRIVWLVLSLLPNIFSGSIIAFYQSHNPALLSLTAFIPMLMGAGGNSGSQSSTMIIRGMATDEIALKDFFRAAWKELRISLLCAAVLAVVNGVRIALQYNSTLTALMVSLTMLITVITANLLGCMLPMGAKKLKIDPAIMAGPMITTVMDIASIVIYFNIAIRLLGTASRL
ncbi:MAG: magnesium transporter [Oscillospiraceae bacterium]|jgi:magnesium transporter|nr:magnesium transporter [Oscillospiraceae bacterium]